MPLNSQKTRKDRNRSRGNDLIKFLPRLKVCKTKAKNSDRASRPDFLNSQIKRPGSLRRPVTNSRHKSLQRAVFFKNHECINFKIGCIDYTH